MALALDANGKPCILPVTPEGIPAELRDRHQWVAWKAVPPTAS